jgi:hypothetical protein
MRKGPRHAQAVLGSWGRAGATRNRWQAATPIAGYDEFGVPLIAILMALPKQAHSCCNGSTITCGHGTIAFDATGQSNVVRTQHL